MDKILIVSSEIIKDKYSSSLTTYKFIQEASKLYDVDVLTEPMTVVNFTHNCNNIYYTNYIGHKGYVLLKVLNRAYKLIFKYNVYRRLRYSAFVSSLKSMDLNKYSAIIAFGGGDFFEPLEALAAINKSTKYKRIGYVHDPFPFDVYPLPYQEKTTKKTLAQRKKLAKIFLKLDKIAFPSQLLGAWMHSFYNFGLQKIMVIPHGIPEVVEFESDVIVHSFLKEHNLVENEYYLHAGTLLYHRPIEPIIEGFKKYKNSQKSASNCKLLFIGSSQYKIENTDEDVLIINERKPLNLINSLSKCCKGLIIIEHNGEISPFLPGKFPEYLFFNKPILHFGPYNSEINRIVRNFSAPQSSMANFTATLNDTNAIANVFIKGGFNLFQNQTLKDYFRFKSLDKKY